MEKINSVAAVLRIPKGTRLVIVRTMRGPCAPSGRIVKGVRSCQVDFTIDDESSKDNGRESYLHLKGFKVEARVNGFVVTLNGAVCAEYEFAPAGSAAA